MATRREVEIARALRRRATPAEREAWELLRDRRCHSVKFKRQHPLGDFIVDFYSPELHLVLELDGAVHLEPDQAAKDELRTAELESLGVTVVRVLNRDVRAETFDRIISLYRVTPSPPVRVERGSGGEAEPGVAPDR
jgi:very-short-patch-repair endonuclease